MQKYKDVLNNIHKKKSWQYFLLITIIYGKQWVHSSPRLHSQIALVVTPASFLCVSLLSVRHPLSLRCARSSELLAAATTPGSTRALAHLMTCIIPKGTVLTPHAGYFVGGQLWTSTQQCFTICYTHLEECHSAYNPLKCGSWAVL